MLTRLADRMADQPSNKQRQAVAACSTCRRAKMKCVLSGQDARCDRCIKWNRDCIFEAHRRGLWRREQANRAATVQQQPSITTSVARSVVSQQIGGELPPSLSRSTSSGQGTTVVTPVDILEFDAPSSGQDVGFLSRSFVAHKEDTRNLSLDLALDPDRGLLESSKNDRSLSVGGEDSLAFGEDDPINRRIIGLPGAQNLFAGFFDQFNYLVGALDPDLYTFSYTRAASSLLFTVVLSISSTVFRPELRRSLAEHVEGLLGRALLACDPAIENIWSLVCLYYWKDVGDKRGYNLVGFALRMASSADWYTAGGHDASLDPSRSEDDECELQVRQRRDKDRVWLVLGNLDRSSSYFTSRPLSAAPIVRGAASRSWLESDKWTYPNGDTTAVCGNMLNRLARPVYQFVMETRGSSEETAHHQQSKALQNETLAQLMETFNMEVGKWGETWGPVYATFSQPQPCLEPLVYMYQEHIRLYFNSIYLHRLLVSSNFDVSEPMAAVTARTCYWSALRLLKQIVQVGRMDILYYLWDTAHLMTGYSAMMLLKILKLSRVILPEKAIEESLAVLEELSGIHTHAAASIVSCPSLPTERTRAENAIDAQAQLLRGIVKRLEAEVLLSQSNVGGGILEGVEQGDSMAWSFPSADHRLFHIDTPAHNSTGAISLTEIGGYSGLEIGGNNIPTSPFATNVDSSLDADFLDSCFVERGLLSWDMPGIFISSR